MRDFRWNGKLGDRESAIKPREPRALAGLILDSA